jgi:hypothetical protein
VDDWNREILVTVAALENDFTDGAQNITVWYSSESEETAFTLEDEEHVVASSSDND